MAGPGASNGWRPDERAPLRVAMSWNRGSIGSGLGWAEAPQAQPFVLTLVHRTAGRLPELCHQTRPAQLDFHGLRVTAPGRTTQPAVAPEQSQQPAARSQQAADRGQISVALFWIDGAEAGVLHDPREASGSQTRRLQGLLVKQVGLQPAQAVPVVAVAGTGLGQGLAAEIQADGGEAELFQQGGLMAAATARHQHLARWLGGQRVRA